MRRFLVTLLLTVVAAPVCHGQQSNCVDRAPNQNPGCAANPSNGNAGPGNCGGRHGCGGPQGCGCQNCQGAKHVCVHCRNCQRPGSSEPESGDRNPQDSGGGPQGVFVAPPRSGTTVEEGRSVGVRGPVLHFPEMRLGFPTLELPSLVRYRSGARMKLDSAVAPFVSTASAAGAFGARVARPAGSGQESGDRESPEEQDNKDSSESESGNRDSRSPKEICDELKKSIEEIHKQKQLLQAKIEEVNKCLNHLPHSQPAYPGQNAPKCAEPIPTPIPCPVPEHSSMQWQRLPPDKSQPLVADQTPLQRASYAEHLQSVPHQPRLQRLPPVGY